MTDERAAECALAFRNWWADASPQQEETFEDDKAKSREIEEGNTRVECPVPLVPMQSFSAIGGQCSFAGTSMPSGADAGPVPLDSGIRVSVTVENGL